MKQVPSEREIRALIFSRADELAQLLDSGSVLGRKILENHARELLESLDLPLDYLGWTMVVFGSRFWRRKVLSIPAGRRILLLPHCMRNLGQCPGTFDAEGLICHNCGSCELGALQERAQELGCHVLIAEGTPIVMKWIINGRADAILGVGCLNSLERAFEKLQLAGIPAMAVPLLASNCKDSQTDLDMVREMLETPYLEKRPKLALEETASKTWVHLLREAANLFERESFHSLLPAAYDRTSSGPFGETLNTALDFVVRGGKYYRPFITLATYDAMTGSHGTGENGSLAIAQFPEEIRRIAAAIEIFHKASLVHDDIEDEDDFRYGEPTLHRSHGIPIAINVGDFLIGLGYRMIAEQRDRFNGEGAGVTTDIISRLAIAHTKLAEGQGSELNWRRAKRLTLHPSEVLNIYALKTSPAFEAALYAGIRAAAPREVVEQLEGAVMRFSKLIGVAFQIKNDLDDWGGDKFNKIRIGADVLALRPTVLGAFALAGASESEARELFSPEETGLERIRELYQKAGVFEKAERLIEKYADRAREAAAQVSDATLRDLLRHFIDTLIGA